MENMRFKVGDRVRIKSIDWYNENKDEDGDVSCGEYDFVDLMTKFCGKIATIQTCYDLDCYAIKEDNEGYVFTGEMFEGLAEETSQEDEFNKAYQEMVKEADERFKNHKRPKASGVCQECVFAVKDDSPHCGLRGFRSDFNVKSCSAKNNTIPNGFELQSDGYFSWINRKEYPKTYKECCKVLNVAVRDFDILYNMLDTTEIIYTNNLDRLLNSFRKLLICRDAYWKIAGEEMGLGKPWKPSDSDYITGRYCIFVHRGNIICDTPAQDCVLTFPTPEMRDAFYENFKSEIESCKELL